MVTIYFHSPQHTLSPNPDRLQIYLKIYRDIYWETPTAMSAMRPLLPRTLLVRTAVLRYSDDL